MIQIMIADDHSLIREGLKQLVAITKDMDIVCEASNGNDVVDLLQRSKVDILLLDITMPGISGVSLIKKIKVHFPKLPILILTMHNEVQIAKRKLNAGASGYITKDSDPDTLLDAIRKVASNGRYLPSAIAEALAFEKLTNESGPPHELLSDRELQIYLKLVNGLSINAIAEELFISNKTVSAHKARIMQKLNIDNNAKLIQYAIEHNLIDSVI